MRYKEERSRITIEPTNEVEIAYIEEVFGLRQDGDEIRLVRKNAMGLSCIAYLETKVIPPRRETATAWQPRTLSEFIANGSTDVASDRLAKYTWRLHKYLLANKDLACMNAKNLSLILTQRRKTKDWIAVAAISLLLEELTDDKEA